MAKIYKEGSRGEVVKFIQRTVGAATDGVWGIKTTEAVKAWQKEHKLKADGLAGPATLQRMVGLDITKGHINKHITLCRGRNVQYIAIHYTAGASSRKGMAMATRNVFLSRAASADFVVDDETVVQINPDIQNYYCWSVGDAKNKWSRGGRLYGMATNRNTVSIEICSNLKVGASAAMANHDGWYFTEQSLDLAARLVRWLMMVYDVPRDRVVRHYDVSGKLCPGMAGWNDAMLYTIAGEPTKLRNNSARWEGFREKLKI